MSDLKAVTPSQLELDIQSDQKGQDQFEKGDNLNATVLVNKVEVVLGKVLSYHVSV